MRHSFFERFCASNETCRPTRLALCELAHKQSNVVTGLYGMAYAWLMIEGADMIHYVKGRIIETGRESVILDNQGIGYEVYTTGRVLQDLIRKGKEEILLYTHLHIKEDEWTLYGFPDRSDIQAFRKLISVSGIGPKGALSILNIMSVEELYYAIQSGDAKSIAKAQNVGPKTAQRVVVDLKGSFEITGAGLETGSETYGTGDTADRNVISETAEALTALGYSNMDALRAIRKVEGAESMTVEQLLSAALRHL